MWKLLIFNISIVLLFFSCNSPLSGYESTSSGIYYKYLKIGEQKENAKYSDYVTVNITYKTITDSVFFTAKRRFQIRKSQFKGSVNECFAMLSVGDEASFLLSATSFFKKTLQQNIPSFIDSSGYFILEIAMLDFMTKEEFLKEKEEFLAWIEDFSIYEKIKLSNFLNDCNNDYQPESQGLYKQVIKEGFGSFVKLGDTLVLDYEGRFLNGKIFDSTIKRNRTFEYIYGTEWQVIKGLEIAVSKMKEGERSVFVLPSELAFGESGNSNGAIPPFSTLIYEIELIQLRR